MKKYFVILLLECSLIACAQNQEATIISDSTSSLQLDSCQTAYFASGCFWCVEAIYESVEGVEEVVSGYSGGVIKDPTYEQVSSGSTKHAETVKIYYDSSKVSFETLVDIFFNSHDPSTKNAQGPDHGPQYRSIAFYTNDTEKKIILTKINTLKKNKTYSKITTEVVPHEIFYPAEEYHQNYERLHPNHPYIQRVSIPRINAFKKNMPEVLKSAH